MWPFSRPKISQDDLGRLVLLEEKVDSLGRRFAALLEDLEEFYSKVHKARQRVNKEDRDAARNGNSDLPLTREQQKALLRQNLRQGRTG